jgi:hypothetical protein
VFQQYITNNQCKSQELDFEKSRVQSYRKLKMYHCILSLNMSPVLFRHNIDDVRVEQLNNYTRQFLRYKYHAYGNELYNLYQHRNLEQIDDTINSDQSGFLKNIYTKCIGEWMDTKSNEDALLVYHKKTNICIQRLLP